MRMLQWLTSALLASALAMPCAMAQGYVGSAGGGGGGAGGVGGGVGGASLPSQRIINEAPEGNGASLTLSPATVRRVQQELNRLGYNAGPVTGSWDMMTRRAVANFQQAHGLSPVGTLDEATIRSSGSAVMAAVWLAVMAAA